MREKETRNKNDDLKGSRENGICMTARRMGMYIAKAGAKQADKIANMSVKAFETDVNAGGVKAGSQVGWVSGKYSEIKTE